MPLLSRSWIRALLSALAVLAPVRAHAFVEMVRHGYVNCATCHISPGGGGVLTQYGRALSAEVLSTWGASANGGEELPREAAFAYRVIPEPEGVSLGGDFRSVYVYRDTPALRSGEYRFMQADLEVAVVAGSFGFDQSSGYQELEENHYVSRRHYLWWDPSPALRLRAGRFLPSYGLNIPDHLAPTRRDLGWDESRPYGAELYAIEAAWVTPQRSLFGSVFLGRPGEAPGVEPERGVILTPSQAIGESHKVGLSFLQGWRPGGVSRTAFGPWAALGFTPRLYLLSEFDLQRMPDAGAAGGWGGVNWQKLGWEPVQGWHVFATQELSRPRFADPGRVSEAYALGTQWYPRPHFEFQLTWQKRRDSAQLAGFYDLAWLLLHFYP
jgi:hypothetical protein